MLPDQEAMFIDWLFGSDEQGGRFFASLKEMS